MPKNAHPPRVPPKSCSCVLIAIMVVLLCLTAGCATLSSVKVPGFSNAGGDSGGYGSDNSAGGGSGGGTGSSSASGGSGGGSGSSSAGGSSSSLAPGETETSTWQATVSATQTETTVRNAVAKHQKDTSESEQATTSLHFEGSFPVVVEHEKSYEGNDIYRVKFVEGGKEYPVSGSYTGTSSTISHGGWTGCHPMASYTFDQDIQGSIGKTGFDFGFYPDNKLVQLDGSFPVTIHHKSVSSDGECDGEDTDTQDSAFWFQCSSDDKNAKGTEFEKGTRDFRMDGTSYVITCHVSTTREMEDDESIAYTSPSSTTRTTTMKVVLDPVPPTPKKLKANPGGPYTAERGTPLQLDGSKSTGSIIKYTWTFTPGAGCPAGLSLDSAELTGSQISATFLCPVSAKLTVTDGKSTDSATVPVSVTPRDWKTPFSTSAEGFDKGPLATPPWVGKPNSTYEGGASVCGLCYGTADENSDLHPPAKGGSWEPSGGYTIEQVTEPGGPFDQYFYVSDYKMEMNRMAVINPYVMPPSAGGKELLYGMGSFYQHNLDAGYDIDKYLEGIRKHEKDHADRMKAALESADPAKEIEKIVEKEKDTVKNTADKKLHDTEKLICQKSNDASQPPMAETWTGKLSFPTYDTNEWKEGSTEVGGYRDLEPGESCG